MRERSPAVLAALTQLRREVRWRADREPDHLHTRLRVLIRFGHLPMGATVVTLEAIVATIAVDLTARIYMRVGDDGSIALLSTAPGRPWIVVLDPAGVVETAFPAADPEVYLQRAEFVQLGTAREIVASVASGT